MNKSSSKRGPVGSRVGSRVGRGPVGRVGSRSSDGAGAPLRDLLDSWERSLRARNLAPTTRDAQVRNVRRVVEQWAAQDGGPVRVGNVTRATCETWLAGLLDREKPRPLRPLSVRTYYAHLARFFAWCVDDEELAESPMAHVAPPLVPDADAAPPVLDIQQVTQLLNACAGNGFYERRDHAMLRLLFDTGMRHDDLMQLAVGDVDLNDGMVILRNRKGRRLETLPISSKTVRALDRYLRLRTQHADADKPPLWLGRQGPLHYAAIRYIVNQRTAQAGLPHIWPHVARHTFASHWLEREDTKEGDLMVLAGWRSRTMLGRYGRGVAHKRASKEHRRVSPGDQY